MSSISGLPRPRSSLVALKIPLLKEPPKIYNNEIHSPGGKETALRSRRASREDDEKDVLCQRVTRSHDDMNRVLPLLVVFLTSKRNLQVQRLQIRSYSPSWCLQRRYLFSTARLMKIWAICATNLFYLFGRPGIKGIMTTNLSSQSTVE